MMLDKVLIGAAVWLASSETGRKTAVKGFKVLSRLGDYAVKAMPGFLSDGFRDIESFIKESTAEDGAQPGHMQNTTYKEN